jgi:aldehyde:ferredoxin oxidoreductase
MTNIHDNMYADEEAPTFVGARHLGILDQVETSELSPNKARLWIYMMLNRSINNNISVCSFMPYNLDLILEQIKSVTGWNVSSWELMKVSERSINLAQAFNAREGFTSGDDILPDRFFEPIEGDGALKGQTQDRQQFYATRDVIYDMLGWDRQSAAPKNWKLYELGLAWVAEALEKH